MKFKDYLGCSNGRMEFKDYLGCSEHITEAKITVDSLSRHPETVEVIKQKILTGELFQLANGKQVKLVRDDTLKYLDSDLSGFGTNKPKHVFTDTDGNKVRISQLEKTKQLGGMGSTNKKAKVGNNTPLQEVGFLVALDMLLDNIDIDDINNFSSYQPTDRMHVSTDTSLVVEFLLNDKEWMKSSVQGAKALVDELGRSKLLNRTFHHDDVTFNKIRSLGSKISLISKPDKWNPSDVFLVKSFNPSKTDLANIVNYNNYIFESGEVIGISLKKGEKTSLGGSKSINTANKRFKSNYKITQFKDTKGLKEFYKKAIEKIKRSSMSNIITVKTNSTDFDTMYNEMISSASARTNYKSFLKWAPSIIEFFAKNDSNDLNAMLVWLAKNAMSIGVDSCPHIKVLGPKLTYMPGGDSKLEITGINLKLNGDSDANVSFMFHGKAGQFQIRSKGSIPQGMVRPAIKIKDSLPITQLST